MNSGRESANSELGAVSAGNGTPSRMSKTLHERLGSNSSLKRQFKSPLSKNPPRDVPAGGTVTEEELRQRVASLQSRILEADKEIEELKASGHEESELQTRIERLHEYNEIKDVGQMVIGRIAVLEGVQTRDLYPRYGLDLAD